ncbi:MAG: sulfurtransferase, partial [Gammaproteobacteria bacterium]|nr:sulfurtransferase [Gammaproteobacteria bacterium]
MAANNLLQVLEADELNRCLQSADWLIVQVTSLEVFQQAHIAGSVLVTPQELVCGIPPATGRLPELSALQQLFSRIGYTPNKKIVLLDDEGGGWAGRFAWTLDVIGHRTWVYLNGGLHAWIAAGLPLHQGAAEHQGAAQANAATSVKLSIDPAPIAEIDDVLRAIQDPNQVIWDVRSHQEYIGTKQVAARAGHIPGAVNLDWTQLKDAQQKITVNLHAQLSKLGLT